MNMNGLMPVPYYGFTIQVLTLAHIFSSTFDLDRDTYRITNRAEGRGFLGDIFDRLERYPLGPQHAFDVRICEHPQNKMV